MSKKSRKVRAKFQGASISQKQYNSKPVENPQINNLRKAIPVPSGARSVVMKSHNFEYLRGDIQTLSIITGALLIMLIVLTFVVK